MSKVWKNSGAYKMLLEDDFFTDDEYEFAGIYKIENLVDGKVYIGQSRDAITRIITHRQRLNKNKHDNSYLQRAWNKYGEESFNLETVEFSTFDDLTISENKWMEHYKSYERENGYNIIKPSENIKPYLPNQYDKKNMGLNKQKFSDEEMLTYLHEFYYMEGRLPSSRDLEKKTEKGVYPTTYKHRFGSIKNALVLAGLITEEDASNHKKYNIRLNITKEEFLYSIEEFIKANGRFPSQEDKVNNKHLYSDTVMLKYFKTMEEVKKIYGFDKETVLHIEELESLACLRELYEKEGRMSGDLIHEQENFPTEGFFRYNIGKLTDIYKMIDIF